MNNFFKFCWHFGFPFADVDCDAFLNPVTPAPALLSAVSQSLDRPVPGLRLRTALSVSQSRIRRRQLRTSSHPRRLTQDTYKVFSAEIRLDSTLILL